MEDRMMKFYSKESNMLALHAMHGNIRYYQIRRLRFFYNCIQSLKEENYD